MTMYGQYRNPYRRHSAIGLPVSHSFPETEYDDNYVRLAQRSAKRSRPQDNIGFEGLNFAAGTENSDYIFRPVTRAAASNRRREGSWPSGLMDFQTENKEQFRAQQVNRVTRARAASSMGLFQEDGESEAEAVRAKYGRRAATVTAGGRQAGPMFALTTETSARFGRRAGLTERPDKFKMRDNLRTPGPEAKFEAFSAHRETFKPMPVAKAVKYKPKENIKTFDNNYLQALEQNILNNKAKVRSVSLHSLRDEALEVVGEDEILYKAGHYTNTFQ